MDDGIADAINRRDVTLICARLDALDLPKYSGSDHGPWYRAPLTDILMRDDDATRGDRAWFIGALASPVPGIAFDGEPAGGDWDNLFAHFRDAISARRDPEAPHARTGAIQPCGVV
jgi:hypothetical protein